MTRAGFWAALRNYGSMVVVRGNPQALSAGYFLLTIYAFAVFSWGPEAHRHGVRSLFGNHSDLTLWWMATFFLPMALVGYYWQQARTPIALMIPGFVEAEWAAVALILAVVLGLLAGPFLFLGAPVVGTLALSAVGMLLGGGTSTVPTGQKASARRWRVLIVAPVLLLGYVPGVIGRAVFAPWPLAFVILVVAFGSLLAGLRYYPAQAGAEVEGAERRAEARPLGVLPGDGFKQLLTWRPRAIPTVPLPTAFGPSVGPVGALLTSFVLISFLVGLSSVFAMFHGKGFLLALHETGPGAVGQGLSIGVFTTGQWLLNRGEWPMLFAAGRFGGRRHFTQALFFAHTVNAAQRALADALVGTGFAMALGATAGWHAVVLALVIFGLAYGTSYATAIPLLWKELGGKTWAVAFRAGSALLLMTVLTFGALQSGVTVFGALISAAVWLFGVFVAWIAPRRLAEMDWPFEADITTA